MNITTTGQVCARSSGDIILRTGDAMVNGSKVQVQVLSSKEGSCPVNSSGEVGVADLQETHNQFRQHVDSGLKTLAEKQGVGGLPNGPAASPRQVAEAQASPDPHDREELTRQNEEASKSEAEAQANVTNQRQSGG